jgi:hypothetical protein
MVFQTVNSFSRIEELKKFTHEKKSRTGRGAEQHLVDRRDEMHDVSASRSWTGEKRCMMSSADPRARCWSGL